MATHIVYFKRFKQKASLILLYTSSLFLTCGVFSILNQRYLPGMGMMVVWLTSIWNHGTKSSFAKKVDIISNYVLGSVFTVYALYLGHWSILGYSMLAILGHGCSMKWKKDWIHAIGVHIPVCFGFYQYAIL